MFLMIRFRGNVMRCPASIFKCFSYCDTQCISRFFSKASECDASFFSCTAASSVV